ncbi:MAG: hypothetical protein V1709_06205 [Planctomycetota bacterium]
MDWVYDKVIWVAEKLGILHKAASEVGGGGNVGAFGEDIKDVGGYSKAAATNMNEFSDAISGLGDATDKTGDKLDEFGNKIETFDEWVARLAAETEEQNKKIAEAAEDAYKRYQDAMDPIEDRLFQLTHTEEEYAARKLLRDRQVAEESVKAANLPIDEQIKAITDIQKVYDLEINLILKKIEEKKQAEIDSAKQTEESAKIQQAAIKGIIGEYDTLIKTIKNVGEEALKAAQKAASEAFLATIPTIAQTGYKPDYIPQATPVETPQTVYGGITSPESAGVSNIPIYGTKNNTYSPTVNVTVQGDGDTNKIKKVIQDVLDESVNEFSRRGYELNPGIG